VNHHSFRNAFETALRGSGLAIFGVRGDDLLDLGNLDRIHRITVEPIGEQDAEPFLVTASLSWRWSALHTARTNTTEEDVVTEMFGNNDLAGAPTERPWIRVDITLKATLPYGKPLAMPAPRAMRRWLHEATIRLELVEPSTPEDHLRDHGQFAIRAWQEDEPRVHALCRPSGELVLEGLEIAAWQAIDVPRILDDPDHDPDPGPGEELAAMFGRIQAALSGWMQALDHLRA